MNWHKTKITQFFRVQSTFILGLCALMSGACRSSANRALSAQSALLFKEEPKFIWGRSHPADASSAQVVSNPLDRSHLQRIAELPVLDIQTQLNAETGEQELSLKASQDARIFYTLDGSVPVVNGLRPLGSTKPFLAQEKIAQPTIVRAIAVNARGLSSILRSALVVPRRADFRLNKLPQQPKQVKAVYVTGPFRGWSTAFDDAFKLTPQTDGSFQRTVLLDRSENVLYKFVVRFEDETFEWLADGSQPQSGMAPYNNNILYSSRVLLSKLFIGKRDGIIDEAAIDFDMQSVAALDAGERLVRFKLKMFEGDAETVAVRFSDGQQMTLASQSTYSVDTLRYTVYSGLLTLPERSLQSNYVIVAKDSNSSFYLGKNGILTSDPFSDTQRGNTFEFNYDARNQQINGADLYQVPLWAVDTSWYQIFPERFRNGDPSNDVVGILPTEWEKSSGALSRLNRTMSPWTTSWFSFTPVEREIERIVRQTQPELDPREVQRQIIFTRRYGGDLRGVRQMIPYLKSLGISGVYFNPVFDSDSLHRYDTKDYRHVDPKLGPMTIGPDGKPDLYEDDKRLLANEKLGDPSTWKFTRADKEFFILVNELQANGIRVVIDGVFNHSASNGPLVEDIARHGRASPYYEWFATSYEGEANYYARSCQLSEFYPDSQKYPFASKIRFDSWAGFCPLINHRQGYANGSLHPELQKYFFAAMDRWLEPKTVDGIAFKGVDGIRLDVYADIPAPFWRLFRQHVKGINRDALIIAEDWYDGFDILRGDQADGIMNYRARTLAESWFINPDLRNKFTPSSARNFMEGRLNGYREHTKHALWTMLDSHDTDRFLSKTIWQNRWLSNRPQDGNSWDNDTVNKPDRGALYSNDKPGVLEKEFFKGIVAFQMAYVGAPVVYYGAEVGMWGADDPTCRKPMLWDDLGQGGQLETQCVTHPGTWCLENQNVKFSSNPDWDLLAAYQRMILARRDHPALRRGRLNSSLVVSVDNKTFTIGSAEADSSWLWGFERAYGDKNFAYFLSNELMSKDTQTVQIQTRFIPGRDAVELVSGRSFTVDERGRITVTIGRERSVLFVQSH
jgi:glycosidase